MKRLVLLVILVLFPVMVWAAAPALDPVADGNDTSYTFQRFDHKFTSHGLQCGAWLYLPDGVTKPPVVIMGHGFGGQRWMRLPAYAERFAQHGMAVFVFDYRGFYDSEGEPRNYINPSRHLEDWKAALAYVRTLDTVDASRIALWGTSFSGGHVIAIAAQDKEVKAIISQVPFTDGYTTALSYFKHPVFIAKAAYHTSLDIIESSFTSKRHVIGIAGSPDGPFAMLSRPDTMPGIEKMLNLTQEQWNTLNLKCPANIVLTLALYRPTAYAKQVNCPALIIGAEKDTLFPPDGPQKAAQKMPQATYVSEPMGHFDPYVGERFEKYSQIMTDFLSRNLGVNGQAVATAAANHDQPADSDTTK